MPYEELDDLPDSVKRNPLENPKTRLFYGPCVPNASFARVAIAASVRGSEPTRL